MTFAWMTTIDKGTLMLHIQHEILATQSVRNQNARKHKKHLELPTFLFRNIATWLILFGYHTVTIRF